MMHSNNKPGSKEEIKAFFKQWSVYQKVIDRNYMLHREMSETLKATLPETKNKAINILDAGCGDAAFIAKAFGDQYIEQYCGIDLSAAALHYAAINLRGIGCKTRLFEGDFAAAMQQIDDRFDVIIAGFSLHHLSTPAKSDFFASAKKLLANDGWLLIYDLIRNNDEDRAQYLQRLCATYQQQWTAMSEQEMEDILNHINHNDYPETLDFYPQMAAEHAFSHYQLRFRDTAALYGFCCFRK